MSYKNKKFSTTLNHIKYFLTLVFVADKCISASAFFSLVDISATIMSSAIGLKTSAIIGRIKKHKLIIKKKKNKHETAFSAKA